MKGSRIVSKRSPCGTDSTGRVQGMMSCDPCSLTTCDANMQLVHRPICKNEALSVGLKLCARSYNDNSNNSFWTRGVKVPCHFRFQERMFRLWKKLRYVVVMVNIVILHIYN